MAINEERLSVTVISSGRAKTIDPIGGPHGHINLGAVPVEVFGDLAVDLGAVDVTVSARTGLKA